MKKETLTIETDEYGTIRYRNASGQLHNANGPAVIYADGGKWYYADGRKKYYINGEKLTEADFKTWQAQQSSPLHNTTAVIDGIEYTLTAK
jgi:hypothetical protein